MLGKKSSASAKKSNGFLESLRTIGGAVLIALVVRTLAFEPFNIPSGSMIPTLLVKDYLFVSKFSYGYSRHSLPFSPDMFEGRIFASEPERGDVVVFKLPADNRTDYIKRVIGLPGDRIQVLAGVLHINGEPVQRERIADYSGVDPYGVVTKGVQYVETLPNGKRHLIVEASDIEPMDNTQLYVVPPNHFFMMGDNRDGSLDSRALSAVGYVPAENLVGRAEFLWFSMGGDFWEVWKWRFDRFFDGIQ